MPRLRRHQAAFFPGKQRGPQLVFQLQKILAQGGLGDKQLLRRVGHALLPGDLQNILRVLDVHPFAPFNKKVPSILLILTIGFTVLTFRRAGFMISLQQGSGPVKGLRMQILNQRSCTMMKNDLSRVYGYEARVMSAAASSKQNRPLSVNKKYYDLVKNYLKFGGLV